MLMTEKRLEWTQRLVEELDNLRAAVDWAYTGGEDFESGLKDRGCAGLPLYGIPGILGGSNSMG